MKKILSILFFSFLLFFLSGCLTTLYPIFYEKDIVFNENLLGYWKSVDKQNKTTGFLDIKKIPDDRKSELTENIKKISGKGYLISLLNPDEEMDGLYFVFLVKIGKNKYFDFYPAETETQKKVNDEYKNHFIKFHTNYRCEIKDNNHFEMKLFDKDFLEQLIKKQQIHLRYEGTEEDHKIITATTEELQKFISQYGDNPKAYTAEISYCVRMMDL